MKKLALIAAASLIGTAAYAQETTVIHRNGVGSHTVVKERSSDMGDADVVVKRKTVTTGSVGCSSKTMSKTNELGETTVKKKTTC
jgi:hypothetical protein